MIRDRAKLSAAFAVVLLSGCGGEPGSVEDLDGSTQATVTTSEATTVAPTSTDATTTTQGGVDEAALDIPLVPESELPEGFPPVPVPAGGALDETIEFFLEESVVYEFPSGALPGLISFYEAWFATQGIDPGPTFGSSPSRFWDVMVDGERVKFELFVIDGTDRARLSILYFE
jgi:uncharacterized protein YceK